VVVVVVDVEMFISSFSSIAVVDDVIDVSAALLALFMALFMASIAVDFAILMRSALDAKIVDPIT
tara:strand:- start:130 stop:324 length:195 start_codon:yes stop_codon:yes gene_type:complete